MFAVVLNVAVTPVLALHPAVLAGLVVTAPLNCPEAGSLSVALYDCVEESSVKRAHLMTVLLLFQFVSVVGLVA